MSPLRRVGRLVERRLERRMPGHGDDPLLEPYRGFATPDRLVVRGRVLSALRRSEPEPEQSRWTNLKQMMSLFFTAEVAGVEVVAPKSGVRGRSDPEGYVRLEMPRGDQAPGWHQVAVEIAGQPETRTAFPVLIPRLDARLGIISDIDDTMIETGSYSLARNLWTTFTGSALTRRVFDDSVRLMAALTEGGRNPAYYVSSSPWNLHHFLDHLFAQAGLGSGPMFLRDFGLGGTAGHQDHKTEAIAAILEANPELDFVLLGDTGQKDAFVYRDAVLRDPGRIRLVALREPAVGSPPSSRAAIAEIEAAGVRCHHAPTFEDVQLPG
ncbi:phosphatase domain-containing protein [Roseitranquillus sediminis]|uniref:phosphatase domain-containing protein n=1 Tax=Roseitranquillus sediminis TaxID=2809051 RepID=UPI001D0C4E60|nr:phosphatase domain-containing protein [Roseitranquillus sediminis]MBM9596220.1 DUF2183 domain-containing protein [Roseitranquillus sediminis]